MRTLQDDQSTSQTALAAAVKDVEALATERLHRADEDRRAAEELAEEAEADAAKNRARIVELEAELTSRNAQIASTLEEKHKLASYIAELSAADEERARLRVAGRKRQTANGRSSADRFTEAILPNITLSNEALDTLLSIKNPSKVFAVLYELNGGTTVPAKVFKGTNSLRVMEVDRHLHIGDEGKSSDMGRVYYCRTEGRVLVHIHRKQSDNEQRQTVERFAAWCREELSN
ncbi:hypothetical protein A7G45_20895 [Mycolicibacterium llatzerense]|nr:hypothetical protein [Mycolicibacterium llatzerense]